MKFIRRGNLGDLSYFLSNGSCFFHRFADSGFRNKWTGMWSGEKKLLEYFAVKIGDEWLSPDNAESIRYGFSECVHTYGTKYGKVRETLFIPEGNNALMVEILCEKTADIEVKPAVNIRLSNENETKRGYEVMRHGNSFTAGSVMGDVQFVFDPGCRLKVMNAYETHRPSDEPQNYFIPALIRTRGRRLLFSAGTEGMNLADYGRLLREKREKYSSIVNGKIKSDCRVLEDAFNSCSIAMEMLRGEHGYRAGLPWFHEYWGRDTFWSLQAAMSLGEFGHARNVIEFFSENARDGCIPNFVSESSGNSFNSIDATLLWMISLADLIRRTGDTVFLASIFGKVEESVDYIFSREKNGFIRHDSEAGETWMDTQRRPANAVEVQALYHGFLRAAAYLAGTSGSDEMAKKLSGKLRMLENMFDREFFRDGFYTDSIGPGVPVKKRTSNAVVPLFMGLGRKCSAVLKPIESDEFSCAKGVRTLSRRDHEFNPSGYHNGSAWSLTTLWAAAAQFRCGRPEAGWNNMRKMIRDMSMDALDCIGECWDSETGAIIGCPLQLWGEAMFIRLVDEFMLGIEMDALKNALKVSPAFPGDVKRIRRLVFMGGSALNLDVRRTGKRYAIFCDRNDVKLIKKKGQ